MLRSYCPEILVPHDSTLGPPSEKHLFHIEDLNLKTSYQIASLFDRYIDMDERLHWNPDGSIMIIS